MTSNKTKAIFIAHPKTLSKNRKGLSESRENRRGKEQDFILDIIAT